MSDDWKNWIVILRVQAQNRYPPNEWNWGTAPCSADATEAELLAALPEDEVSRILRLPKK
jgi:hypothetical protein